MKLNVRKLGNSLAVILPKEVTESLKVEKGDALFLNETSDGFKISPYDPEFASQMEAARKIMKKRRNALKELAK